MKEHDLKLKGAEIFAWKNYILSAVGLYLLGHTKVKRVGYNGNLILNS